MEVRVDHDHETVVVEPEADLSVFGFPARLSSSHHRHPTRHLHGVPNRFIDEVIYVKSRSARERRDCRDVSPLNITIRLREGVYVDMRGRIGSHAIVGC